MTKQYRRALFTSIHETPEAVNTAGLMGKQTMCEFDSLCLTPMRPSSAPVPPSD